MLKNDLEKQIQEIYKILNDIFNQYNKVCLLFSGGIDSTCLLHILDIYFKKQKIDNNRMLIVNINHKMRRSSYLDYNILSKYVLKNTNFKLTQYTVNKNTNSETSARKERLLTMSKISKNENIQCFIMAHHLNDVVETFLIRANRGSGPNGLSSIKKYQNFYLNNVKFIVVRPLLLFKKEFILKWSNCMNVKAVINDETNNSNKIHRVLIRKNIIPYISIEGFYSTIVKQNKINDFIMNYVNDFFKNNVEINKFGIISLNKNKFDLLDCVIKYEVIKKICSILNFNHQIREENISLFISKIANEHISKCWSFGRCIFTVEKNFIKCCIEPLKLKEINIQSNSTEIYYLFNINNTSNDNIKIINRFKANKLITENELNVQNKKFAKIVNKTLPYNEKISENLIKLIINL